MVARLDDREEVQRRDHGDGLAVNSKMRWTAERTEELRAIFRDKTTREIAAHFGITRVAAASRIKVLGLVRGKKKKWSESDNQLLAGRYADTSTKALASELGCSIDQVYRHAHILGLTKSEEFLGSYKCGRFRGDIKAGVPYRFKKGQLPANAGLRRPGYAPGNMSSTQFRKGAKPHTWRPIGTIVIDSEGYQKVKISDDRTVPSRFNWSFVHVKVWSAAYGSVPRGHAVVFRDGDKSNLALDNLELITRRELMLRNTIYNLPPELVQVIQLNGAVKRKIRSISNGKEQNIGSAGSPVRNARSVEGQGSANGDRASEGNL